MGDYGVSVIWGDTKTGREKKALELWADALTANEKLVADAAVDRWDVIVFQPSAGPSGAMRYYGSADQMDALVRSEVFSTLVARGQLLLNDFGVRRFVTGQALAEEVGRFSALIDSM